MSQGTVSHVANQVLGHAHDLRGFRTVHRVKVRVVLQAVAARRREDGGDTLDRGSVGHGTALPFDDAIGTEIKFEFTPVVGGDHITMRAQARFGGVEGGLAVDQFIEARDVLSRSHSPDAGRRRRGQQSDAVRQGTEEQIVIDEIRFIGIQVVTKTALVTQHARQLSDDPVAKLQPLDHLGLLALGRWHLPQGDL